MSTPEKQDHENEKKKTVYKETDNSEDLTGGETSSESESGRTAFTHRPERKNKPLGSSHEPGVTPGREF
ncbi:hypothetical protein HDF26_003107 [Pedobacter cryoconitis]|uniref:Uncharacterized protein n=1 Tax=Pedobacter cryoconitis TaxID=188932 RepID=A0A7W8ZI77_9SPHI|nr:hypothetical protein [Pedobacter cryoconitis]MBB5634228.1 hypothetical protein [Pedobacter cryoconitis]MBB6272650.1 hypothetical protein [Pedobacter cryoconitis]